MSIVVLSAAIALGKTLLKSAVGAATGSPDVGDAAGEVAGVFGDRLLEKSAERAARRRIEQLTDTVGARVLGHYQYEFRSLSEQQRAVVVEAVDETFKRVPPASRLVIEEDFDPALVDARIRGLTDVYVSGRVFNEDETSLYRLLLRESCAAVVQLVRGTSGLSDLAVPEILTRLTTIETLISQAPTLAIAAAERRRDDEFTKQYRDFIGRRLNTLDLYSYRLRPESRRYPLPLAYFSLMAHVRGEKPERIRLEEAVADRRRVLLRAYCGAGKTTYMYRWFVLAATGGLPGQSLSSGSVLPLYLPLDRYSAGGLPEPVDFVRSVGNLILGAMPDGWIQRQLDQERSLVLINGLDEVPVAGREKALEWISELIDQFPNPRYVLASRPGVLDDPWLAAQKFAVVDLDGMGPADSRDFILRWHEAAKSNLSGEEARARVDACATALLDAVASCHALRALARHPLTCALMCALHCEGQFDLPHQWLPWSTWSSRSWFASAIASGGSRRNPAWRTVGTWGSSRISRIG